MFDEYVLDVSMEFPCFVPYDKEGVPVGTKVIHEKEEDVGKTGKLLCTIPRGGGLFYTKEELNPVD